MFSTLVEDDDFEPYEGPAFDILSIILVVLIVVSIGLCIWMYNQKEEDTEKIIKKHKYISYSTIAIFALMFWLGLNLMIRYINGQCEYTPGVYCGGGSTRGGTGTRARSSDKACSSKCVLLNVFGILLICLSGVLLPTYLFCLWRKRDSSKTSNNEKMKIGCECCHCYV